MIISTAFLFYGTISVAYVFRYESNIISVFKNYARIALARLDILNSPGHNFFSKGSSIASNPYNLHRQAAMNASLQLIHNEFELQACIENGTLSKVNNGNGYKIGTLHYSKPYLTKEAYEVLQEIGQQFKDKTGRNYFVVSSLTRTVQTQKELCNNNVNASRNTSTHCYGCSFDISYSRFNGRRGYNSKLQAELESILKRLQKEGKIYVLAEKRTYCYHVTVIK